MGIAHLFRAKAYWAHPLDEKLSPQMRSGVTCDLRVVEFFLGATKRSKATKKGPKQVVYRV